MRKRRTQSTNASLGYPGDSSRDLPVCQEVVDGIPVRTSVWELEPAERAAIATGQANVALSVWGHLHPAVSVGISRDRILPIDPDESVPDPDRRLLWLEVERELVDDLLNVLAGVGAVVAATHEGQRRVDRLVEFRSRLDIYRPLLDEDASE